MSKKVSMYFYFLVLCICKTSSEESDVVSGSLPPTEDSSNHKDDPVVFINEVDIQSEPNQPNQPYLPNQPYPSGAIYIHWGRTDCAPHSELVYEGIAAGSKYSYHGGGFNVLCVPLDPLFVNPVGGEGGTRAFLLSIEYQISDFPLYQNYHSHDVSCAVCKATGRFSHLMIPGKPICPSDKWTLEYEGYLMAERTHSSHRRSEFLCMDRAPYSVPGSTGWASGSSGRLSIVESKCSTSGGGLPCGRFQSGSEVTCAVCTI